MQTGLATAPREAHHDDGPEPPRERLGVSYSTNPGHHISAAINRSTLPVNAHQKKYWWFAFDYIPKAFARVRGYRIFELEMWSLE